MTLTVWRGTEEELSLLQQIICRNGDCSCPDDGEWLPGCAVHRKIADDQRLLNGLVFARRIARRLEAEEKTRQRVQPAA